MKILVACCFSLVASMSLAQSKKELAAEVAKLKGEIEQLKKLKDVDLSNDKQKASYGVGILIASNLKAQGGDSLDLFNIRTGITDVFMNNPLKMDKQEASGYIQNYLQKAMEIKIAKIRETGVAFLTANKLKDGVVTTATGLQYKIITSGKGKMPAASDQVMVNYTGSTIDGNIFDSSAKSGRPATFVVSGVIAGWSEALQLMHEGDKWALYIPSELGYGERGSGAQIPPYSTLVFEIELIKVN